MSDLGNATDKILGDFLEEKERVVKRGVPTSEICLDWFQLRFLQAALEQGCESLVDLRRGMFLQEIGWPLLKLIEEELKDMELRRTW